MYNMNMHVVVYYVTTYKDILFKVLFPTSVIIGKRSSTLIDKEKDSN